jgi:hypothetical protein
MQTETRIFDKISNAGMQTYVVPADLVILKPWTSNPEPW